MVALFLKAWELGRAALSCHMAMDFLCQEMRDACWDSSESLGSPPFTVITVPVNFSCGTVTAAKPFSHRGRAVIRKEWDVVREKKRRKRDRSLLTERACRSVNTWCLFFWSEQFRRFQTCLCVLCKVQKVERRLDRLSDGS